jgi:hypothetical protein
MSAKFDFKVYPPYGRTQKNPPKPMQGVQKIKVLNTT